MPQPHLAKTMKRTIFILSATLSFSVLAQVRTDNRDRLYPTLLDKGSSVTDAQVKEVQELFQTIESGILAGNVAAFSKHFDRQIFVNVTRGESGYFSADQAASLLHHYLATRKVISFKFSRLSDKSLTPYATGRLVTLFKGTQESAQVYVSCSMQNREWVIGQFNIY